MTKMPQYKSVYEKWCKSQLKNLRSATNKEKKVILKLTSSMIGNSEDKGKFTFKIL